MKSNKETERILERLEKLRRFEDLEQSGRLTKLPCVIGGTVYTNISMQLRRKNRPYEAKVVFIGINGHDNFFNVELGEGKTVQFQFSEIGKVVFLTKEEAEEALKESEQE